MTADRIIAAALYVVAGQCLAAAVVCFAQCLTLLFPGVFP